MNHIERLIEEICPDGVPFKPLGQVALVKRGTSITKKDIRPGEVPVIAGGRTPAYFHADANRVGPLITVAGSGAYAGFVSFWEQPIFVSDASSIETDPLSLLPRFAFHLLKWKQDLLHSLKSGGGVPHVYAKDIAKIVVPTPPLAVQREIVAILDKFSKLEAELEAELEARRLQLSALKSLLLFNATPNTKMGDVAQMIRERPLGGPQPYVSIEHLPQGFAEPVITEPTESPKGIQFHPGDSLFGNIRPYLKKGWLATSPGVASSDILTIRKKSSAQITPSFLFEIISSDEFIAYMTQNSRGGAMPRGDKSAALRFSFNLPSLEAQEFQSRLFASFRKVLFSLTDGLPAEITARRQQYEYYRDRLLTFKELQ